MARQNQDQERLSLKTRKLKPEENDRFFFILWEDETEIAKFDLNNRNPGEVFKIGITSPDHDYSIKNILDETTLIEFHGNGTRLEAECKGWFGNCIYIHHNDKEYQLLRTLLTRNFILVEENMIEVGRIQPESFFSDNYLIQFSKDFSFLLLLFICGLALCDSERPQMPVSNSYWYYG